jgi:hypothetical protein
VARQTFSAGRGRWWEEISPPAFSGRKVTPGADEETSRGL